MADDSSTQPVGYARAWREVRRGLESGELGFVATAMSTWHALGVDAWIHRLRKDGEKRAGIVLLLAMDRRGIVISKANFASAASDPNVTFLPVGRPTEDTGTSTAGLLLRMFLRVLRLMAAAGPSRLRSRPIIRLASPWTYSAGVYTLAGASTWSTVVSNAFEFVALDEGIGVYTPKQVVRMSHAREREKSGRIAPSAGLDQVLYGTWKIVQDLTARLHRHQTRYVFHCRSDGSLEVNPSVAEDYREALAYLPQSEALGGNEPIALLATQPWVAMGEITADAYLRQVDRSIEFLRSRGYRVLLKPHPREDRRAYEHLLSAEDAACRLAPQAVAAEAIFSQLHPGRDVVVSEVSTCLLTASLLFNLGAHTLGGDLAMHRDTGPIYKQAYRTIVRLGGPNIKPLSQLPVAVSS